MTVLCWGRKEKKKKKNVRVKRMKTRRIVIRYSFIARFVLSLFAL